MAEITPTSVVLKQTEANHIAARAIDKDLSTAAVTFNEHEAVWLKLKFEKTYLMHKIIIYYKFYNYWYFGSKSWCDQSVDNFKTCLNIDSNVDVSVYQGDVKQKSCGPLQLTYGLEQSDQIYTLLCMAEGDTVKFSKSTGTIVLFDVVVIGRCKCALTT